MTFERWYSEVAVGNDAEARFKAREAGVAALAKATSTQGIESLLRIAIGGKFTSDSTSLSTFRQPFIEKDPAFELEGNSEELRVLSAATLAHIMRTSTVLSPRAVLSVLSASLGGNRVISTTVPLVEIAKQELTQDAERTRSRPDLAANLTEVPKLEFDKAKAKLESQQDFQGVIAALPLIAESIRALSKVTLQRQADAYSALARYATIQDEEIDMLWWLVGGRSMDFDCSFEKLAVETQPLVLAKELADRTGTLPGPIAIPSLLARAGLKDAKKLSVVSAVNGLDSDWASALLDGAVASAILTPVHFAIQRELETGAGDAWVAGWAAASGVAPDSSLTPLRLATQFYFERLLLSRES